MGSGAGEGGEGGNWSQRAAFHMNGGGGPPPPSLCWIRGCVLHTHYCLEKVVRRRALFIESATAFAVLAVASAPPM